MYILPPEILLETDWIGFWTAVRCARGEFAVGKALNLCARAGSKFATKQDVLPEILPESPIRNPAEIAHIPERV